MYYQISSFHPRRLLVFAALVFAFIAQYLFTGEWFTRLQDTNGWEWLPSYTYAIICLLSALLCASWAMVERTTGVAESMAAMAIAARSYPLLLATCVCVIFSFIIYLVSGESLVVRFFWASSIVLFISGVWVSTSKTSMQPTYRFESAIVVFVTIIGAAVRFWQLGELPAQIDNDIPLVGVAALDLIASDNYNWVGYSNAALHLQSYPQFYAWSMRLFGENIFGLVITSAIAGTLTLPIVYALGRELYNSRVGLIGMALLALNYTHIQFSRTMFGPKATLFAVLTIYLIFRGLRRREPVWFGLGGLAAGLGLLSYDSSRVVPVICLIAVAWWLIWNRAQLRVNLSGIALFVLGMVVGFGPMLIYGFIHFDQFMGRGNVVTLWSPLIWQHAQSVYGVQSVPEILFMQAIRTFLTFHLYGDSSPHFSLQRPMVDSLTATLLVLGVGTLLLRIRDLRAFTLLLWLGATLILGGVLTYDPPYWPHLNIALPAAVLIAAVGAEAIFVSCPVSIRTWGQPLLVAILCSAIAFTAIHNWEVYYTYTKDNAGPRNRISREIATLPREYRVYLISDEYTPDNFVFRFFNRETQIYQSRANELMQQPPTLNQPVLFVVHNHDEVLPMLAAAYPTAKVAAHTNREGRILFTTVRVVPANYPLLHEATQDPSASPWLLSLLVGICLGWVAHSVRVQLAATIAKLASPP